MPRLPDFPAPTLSVVHVYCSSHAANERSRSEHTLNYVFIISPPLSSVDTVMSLKRGRAARRRASKLTALALCPLIFSRKAAKSYIYIIEQACQQFSSSNRSRSSGGHKEGGIRHLRSAIRGLYLWRIEMSQVKSLAFSANFVVSINTITLVPGPTNL